MNQFAEQVRHWFLEVKRDLPWRRNATPYGIWVSEIMLQQTQVAVVIPYYERWMAAFPTVAALARASQEEVIKYWEGLGYYQRARSLHAGAQYVMEQWGGELPRSKELLRQIPGLGPYTVGAVLNFAFHERAALVDGNVIRVVSRYCGVEGEVEKPAVNRRIWELTEELLPQKEPWVVAEGLMELGAMVCTPQPRCQQCPVAVGCSARKSGDPTRLPMRRPKPAVQQLYRAVAVVRSPAGFLVRRGEKGQIMADLYQFPYFETGPQGVDEVEQTQWVRKELGLEAKAVKELPPISQSFTRYRVQLKARLFETGEVQVDGYQWAKAPRELPFCSGHRRLLRADLIH